MEGKELIMDWQTWVAAAIAIIAGMWAAWKILRPIVNEFRKKKMPEAGCGGCGCGTAACTTEKKIDARV